MKMLIKLRFEPLGTNYNLSLLLFFLFFLGFTSLAGCKSKAPISTLPSVKQVDFFKIFSHLQKGSTSGAITPLKDGKILIIDSSPAEIFDPKTKSSELLPGIKELYNCWATPMTPLPLPDGNILVTGKFQCRDREALAQHKVENIYLKQGIFNTAFLYNYKAKVFSKINFELPPLFSGYTTVHLPNDMMLFIGSHSSSETSQKISDLALVDLRNLSVKYQANLNEHRVSPGAFLINKDEVLISGGKWPDAMDGLSSVHQLDSLEVFNLKTRKSKRIGHLKISGGSQSKFFIPINDNRFIFTERWNPSSKFQNLEIYDYFSPNHSLILQFKRLGKRDYTSRYLAFSNHDVISIGKYIRQIDYKNQDIHMLGYMGKTWPKTFIPSKEGSFLGFMNEHNAENAKTIYYIDYKKYLEESGK